MGLYLLQAGLSLYIYKGERLAARAVEDVAMCRLDVGELTEPMAAVLLVAYRLGCIALYESLDTSAVGGRGALYLEAMKEAQSVLLQPAGSHHHFRGVRPDSQLVESRLYGESLLGMSLDAQAEEHQYEGN